LMSKRGCEAKDPRDASNDLTARRKFQGYIERRGAGSNIPARTVVGKTCGRINKKEMSAGAAAKEEQRICRSANTKDCSILI